MILNTTSYFIGAIVGIIVIVFILILTSVLIYNQLKDSNDYESENQQICFSHCIDDGWQYGEYIGGNFCNCWDESIIQNDT